MILVLCIYAFPIRLFDLGNTEYNALKIVKCLLFSIIILRLIKNEFGSIKYLFGVIDKRIVFYLPVIILSCIYILLNLSKFEYINNDNIVLTSLTLSATLLATFSEELVFRGYFQKLLIKSNINIKQSIIFSSIIFSSMHFANIYRNDYDIWSVFSQISVAFFIGIFLGSLFVLRQNIIFVTSLHFIYNIPASLYSIRSIELERISDGANTPVSLLENIFSVILYILIHFRMNPITSCHDFFLC